MDRIALSWVHGQFFGQDATQAPPVSQIQRSTLRMIRELISERLFVLGNLASSKTHPTDFIEWDLPLDDAMAKIEKTYIDNHDDRDSWYFMVWLTHTAKGEKLALEIYREDYPEGPTWPGWKPRFN